MTPEQFAELSAQNFNRIPVVREVLADLDTPLSTYMKLANQPYSYLLESVEGGEKWGRYSIIGFPCRTVLKVYGYSVMVETDGEVVEQSEVADPLEFVEQFQARYRAAELPGLPRFNGGLVGYFGYDCVRYVEQRLANSIPEDVIGTPDILLMVSDEVVVFDNLSGKLILISHADPGEEDALGQAQLRLDELVSRLRFSVPYHDTQPTERREVSESEFKSSFGEQQFKDSVDRIKEYILSGDVMQTVISQRMTIPFTSSPLDLYRALRWLNPSPYMYVLHLGDHHVTVKTQMWLHDMTERGLRLSVDHVGTSGKSFGFLAHFPVYQGKIERRCIRDIHEHKENAFVVSGMIQVFQAQRALCFAEGVEKQEEIDALTQLGVDGVMGYAVGRPLLLEIPKPQQIGAHIVDDES